MLIPPIIISPSVILISTLVVVPLIPSFSSGLTRESSLNRNDLVGSHPVGTDLPLVADLCRARVVLLELLAD